MTPSKPSLGFLLADASRLVRRRFEQESRDLPMTWAQLRIVARLSHNEGVGQAALAALLDIEPMTLSRHVDRMQAAGFVVRAPDPNDRRARRLYTTERGRALLAPMRERAAGVYEQVLAGVSPEAQASLVATLETIIANLANNDPADPAAEVDAGAAERWIA